MAARKAAKKKVAKRAAAKPPARPRPRADKGEGEGAVRARIAALGEPARGIMEKLHPLVMKHGASLEPTVKWGHAVYLKKGKMVLIAAPRKKHVGFGYPTIAGIDEEPIELRSTQDVDEATVARMVKRVA